MSGFYTEITAYNYYGRPGYAVNIGVSAEPAAYNALQLSFGAHGPNRFLFGYKHLGSAIAYLDVESQIEEFAQALKTGIHQPWHHEMAVAGEPVGGLLIVSTSPPLLVTVTFRLGDGAFPAAMTAHQAAVLHNQVSEAAQYF